MGDRLAIGVDLGGTKIAFVTIDEQGNVVDRHQVLTGVADGTDAILDRIAQGIQVLLAKVAEPVAGIGIGSPGDINPLTGTVRSAVNLRWDEIPLSAAVRQRLPSDIPIWLQKDTNAAVLGEVYYGAARGCKDVVLIAIGTGLGVGVMVDGKIVLGANNAATDLGHLSLDPAGRQCSCGLKGCVEMYVSGNGLAAGAREHRSAYPQSSLAQTNSPSSAEIIQAARNDDPLGQVVLGEAADWLAKLFIYCGVMLNPAKIVLGGGLGLAAADLLLDRANRYFRDNVRPPIYENLEIVRSQLADSAIGAACLVWDGLR